MSENIKEALAYAVSLDNQKEIIHEVDGRTYYNADHASFVELNKPAYADTLKVNTLTGLVDYLKSKFDEEKNEAPSELLINIESPEKVSVHSQLNSERRRETLVAAEVSLDRFPYGRFQDSEKFIINLQSLFARDLDAGIVLECASSIRIEGGGDLNDNGVSQTVTVRQGATAGKAEVPSPADLRPFRTFLEVEQPSSSFVFRIGKNGECALFEADGGIWKLIAMQSIKDYLEKTLEEDIKNKRITIIA